MTVSSYEIRVCENPACGLRYPLVEGHPFGTRCPRCLGGTRATGRWPLGAEMAQEAENDNTAGGLRPKAIRLYAVLDNIRSAWNVGAIFRTADGLGVEKLYLCGITPTPENEAVRKTALGAEQFVSWEYAPDAVCLAARLKAQGWTLWAIEQDQRAVELPGSGWGEAEQADGETDEEADGKRIALVFGNEVTGVDPALLNACDRIFAIPMRGRKRSLNVEVAFAIAVWTISGWQTDRSGGETNKRNYLPSP